MVVLVLLLGFVILFAGFLSLTAIEAKTGVRVFRVLRTRMDAGVRSGRALTREVSFVLLVIHFVRVFVDKLVHEVIHITLPTVRAFERVLLKTVQDLQRRERNLHLSEAQSQFVKTVSYFKRTIRARPKADRVVHDSAPSKEAE